MKKRFEEFDIIRALATISVILIHVTGAYATKSKYAYIVNQVVRYSVPLFIIISGFLLHLSDKDSVNFSTKNFYLKRFKKIFIPYAVWSIFFNIYNNNNFDILTSIPLLFKSLLFANSSYHLYFVVIIIQLYFLYPLIRYSLVKFPKATLLISFIITLYYQTMIYLDVLGYHLPRQNLILQNYMIFLTWIFYFVIGMYLSKKILIINKFKNQKSLLYVSWVALSIILVIDSKITNSFELSIKPIIIIYTLITFALFYTLSSQILKSNNASRFLKWVSYQSYFIYFFHVLIIEMLFENLYKISPRPEIINIILNRFSGSVFVFIFVSIITLLFSNIISKSIFANILGGYNNYNSYSKKIENAPLIHSLIKQKSTDDEKYKIS